MKYDIIDVGFFCLMILIMTALFTYFITSTIIKQSIKQETTTMYLQIYHSYSDLDRSLRITDERIVEELCDCEGCYGCDAEFDIRIKRD